MCLKSFLQIEYSPPPRLQPPLDPTTPSSPGRVCVEFWSLFHEHDNPGVSQNHFVIELLSLFEFKI